MSIDLRKYSADKVALLALLVLGFVIAQVIVSTNRGIELSEPISLPQSGLSVRIPMGSSWESSEWLYEGNSFNLFSTLNLDSKPVAQVHCQYLLMPAEGGAEEQIRQRSHHYNGQLVDIDQKNIGSLVMDRGHIITRGQTGVIFFGVVKLDAYRTVTLEVAQRAGLGDMAEEIFDAIAESISFEDNKLLANGAELVRDFKDGRIVDVLYGKDTHRYFLIENESGQQVGFLAEAMAQTENRDGQTAIGAASVYNIDGPAGGNEQSSFTCDVFVDTFRWVNSGTDAQSRAKTATDIVLEQGTVVVRDLVSRQGGQFGFGEAMIPDMLLGPIIAEFLEGNAERIALDLILSEGVVIPVVISKIDHQKNEAAPEDTAYAVEVDFLHEGRSRHLMYFDDYKNLVGIDIQGRRNYKVVAASKEVILGKFPAWQEQILQVDASFQ